MDFVLSIGIMMLASSDEKETDAKRARKKENIFSVETLDRHLLRVLLGVGFTEADAAGRP